MDAAKKDRATWVKISKMEDEIRCKIEEMPTIKESKEVIKKIYLGSIKMNFQAETNVP